MHPSEINSDTDTSEEEATIDTIKTLLDELPLFEDTDLVSPLTPEEIPRKDWFSAPLHLY
jgi:hypothetical protein